MKRVFRSQLDLPSVLKLCAAIGFGSGIFMGLIFWFNALQAGDGLRGILILLLAPVFSAAGNAITGLIGYPFYAWYCDRKKGQHIAGKFAEVTTNQSEE